MRESWLEKSSLNARWGETTDSIKGGCSFLVWKVTFKMVMMEESSSALKTEQTNGGIKVYL